MFDKLETVEKRYEELTQKISDPEVISRTNEWREYMKEHAELEPIVEKYREYKKAKQAYEEAKEMMNDPEMKDLAEKLSKGIPQVRVDFYEVNGKVYFGEMTFFHWSGFKPFEPEKWDEIFGSWINLPDKKKGNRRGNR